MKLFIATLILLSTSAFADTSQFCSPTTIAAAISTVAGKSQATLASASAISPGPCTTPPPPTACQVIPSATAGIANFKRYAGSQTVRYGGVPRSVDVTKYDSVFGGLAGLKWPGEYGLIAMFSLPTNNYVSLAFTVPDNYMTAPNVPVPLFGAYRTGETGNAANVSWSISTSCGAFANPAIYPSSAVVPGCFKNRTLTGGAIQWNGNSSTTCRLYGGQVYYLNFANIDASKVTPNGGTATSTKSLGCSTACSLPAHNFGGTWNGYVPH